MNHYHDRNDCDILKDDAGRLLEVLEESFEKIEQGRMTRTSVVSSLWGIGKGLARLGYDTTRCAVKHTPGAIATVADAKRKLIDAGTEEYYAIKKELAEEALEEKIRALRSAGEKSDKGDT